MKVVLVGSNPSVKSPDNSTFHIQTSSRIILDEWFRDIPCQMLFINISENKTPNNKPLTRNQIRNLLPGFKTRLDSLAGDRVIALGKTAEWALKELNIEHFACPHPSGLCRVWNDKDKADKIISNLRAYVST